MKTITFDREQFYDEIWSTPLSKLSESYGITFQQLKNICVELDIPTPGSGYWTKIRMGKTVEWSKLPPSDKTVLNYSPDSAPKNDLHKRLPEGYEPIKISNHLRSLHPLVQRTYDHLKEERWNGRQRARGSSILDSVTPKLLKRAMRILNAVVLEFERQGFQVHTTSYNELSKSYVKIEQEEVYFHLHERGKRIKKENSSSSWDQYDHINTGELVLGLSDSLYWSRTRMVSDGKTQKLEDRLDKFFLTVLDIANNKKAVRLEREKLYLEAEHRRMKKVEIEEKKRQIKENRERKFQTELNRRVELEKSAQSYISAKQIYQLVEAVEAEIRVVNLNDIQKRHFNKWKGWAMEHANRLNPVKLKVDSILNAEMEF
ncbi:MAG: hypothetical protein WD098_00080 [Balneolales bacterium]